MVEADVVDGLFAAVGVERFFGVLDLVDEDIERSLGELVTLGHAKVDVSDLHIHLDMGGRDGVALGAELSMELDRSTGGFGTVGAFLSGADEEVLASIQLLVPSFGSLFMMALLKLLVLSTNFTPWNDSAMRGTAFPDVR